MMRSFFISNDKAKVIFYFFYLDNGLVSLIFYH